MGAMKGRFLEKLGRGILYLLLLALAYFVGGVYLSLSILPSEVSWVRLMLLCLPVVLVWIAAYCNRLGDENIEYEYRFERERGTLLWVITLIDLRAELLAFWVIWIPLVIAAAFFRRFSLSFGSLLAIPAVCIGAGVAFLLMDILCWVFVCLRWRYRAKHEEAEGEDLWL